MPPAHNSGRRRPTDHDHNVENNVINGICCDVENCVYNNGSCCCTAKEIHVKNRSAQPCETMCETFSEI